MMKNRLFWGVSLFLSTTASAQVKYHISAKMALNGLVMNPRFQTEMYKSGDHDEAERKWDYALGAGIEHVLSPKFSLRTSLEFNRVRLKYVVSELSFGTLHKNGVYRGGDMGPSKLVDVLRMKTLGVGLTPCMSICQKNRNRIYAGIELLGRWQYAQKGNLKFDHNGVPDEIIKKDYSTHTKVTFGLGLIMGISVAESVHNDFSIEPGMIFHFLKVDYDWNQTQSLGYVEYALKVIYTMFWPRSKGDSLTLKRAY